MKTKDLFLSALIALFLPACETMANGRGWGQDATIASGWERVNKAAGNALRAPGTWGFAAGAIAFRIGHADRNVSEWASRTTPVYGSRRNARSMSDTLLYSSGAAWLLSGAAMPGGDTFQESATNKARGFVVQGGTGLVMKGTVDFLKNLTDRERPNGADHDSFPSGHSAGAAFFTTLTMRNIDAAGWSDRAKTVSEYSLHTLTAATAWARIEAKEHYPSDVLAGIAMGRFFGAFLTEAFMGLDNPRHAMVLFEPSREGVQALLVLNF